MAVREQVQSEKRVKRQQSALVGAQSVDGAQEKSDSEKTQEGELMALERCVTGMA
jgi:hypothetical protein